VIVRFDNPSFFELLNKIETFDGWRSPLHTRSGLNYYRQRPLDNKQILVDRSFVISLEDEPVIGFQGATVRIEGKTDLLAYEIPCVTIENKTKLTAKASKIFFREIDKIAHDINGTILYRDWMLNGELSCLSKYLLRQGAKATPIFSQVIDYTKEKATEKSSIRKSYKSLINWGLRELKPRVYDESNITWEHMNIFRQLHIEQAGRETRSEASWRKQYEMVRAGEAFAVCGRINDNVVSAGLFIHGKYNCYYQVSASRRDMFQKPLFHSLMWLAILHAKKLGCRWFEIGEQLYPNHPFDKPPSKKELGISDFKAGFGGETKMFLDLKLDCEHLGE
jgi:hypothetical protein